MKSGAPVWAWMLLALPSLSANATEPAAELSVTAPAAAVGRLFFTPEKRAMLERQRLSNIHATRSLEGATMSLDGVVQRSGGKSTVWINGQPQNERDAVHTGVNVKLSPRNPGHAQLAPGTESPTQLKVGEAINRATGERNDRLGGGAVKAPTRR